MQQKLQNIEIAEFALKTKFEDIGGANIDQLKRHLLDAIGSMLFAIGKPPIKKLVNQLKVLGESGKCKVPILDSLAYDRAAQLFTALIRYPDFMDNYMGKEATCHPSDNIGSLLAAAQYGKASGRDFLTAMAISYQIECRLVNEIPVMKEGIDHTLLLSYSIVAGAGKLVGLTKDQLANALAISGCSIAPMAVSRASYTYEWKGLASSMDALDCMNNIFLAQQGVTGPIALFEGPKGFGEVFDMKLNYDWRSENFSLIHRCVLKTYNAEVHSQASIYTALELKRTHAFNPADVERINVTTFLTAYNIIGSGTYGDRKDVHSKEQADHSLHYLIAVALLDGEIYPEQFEPERIERPDVQDLLQRVFVDTKLPIHKPMALAEMLDQYTASYPDKMQTTVQIILKNGTKLECKKDDYPGFFTRPFSWDDCIDKFMRLTKGQINTGRQNQIIDLVKNLEKSDTGDLVKVVCIR